MGLAASQARYLTLSARKNDLEFAAQTISSRRLQLAYKTAEIARQYSDGMNNKVIKIEVGTDYSTGTYVKQWEHINPSNLKRHKLVLFGTNGLPLGYGQDAEHSPYIEGGNEYYTYKLTEKDDDGKDVSRYLTKSEYEALDADKKSKVVTTRYTQEEYNKLTDDTIKGNCIQTVSSFALNPDYNITKAGNDIESLLISGEACLLDEDFATWLMDHFDRDNGTYSYTDPDTGESRNYTFNEMKNQYINLKGTSARVDIDWRSDITGVMEHKYYTEDDEYVQAKYETETAEIQAQDKMLELEIKNIETQHKAIETELESVQKVIQGNIDKTFKIFS